MKPTTFAERNGRWSRENAAGSCGTTRTKSSCMHLTRACLSLPRSISPSRALNSFPFSLFLVHSLSLSPASFFLSPAAPSSSAACLQEERREKRERGRGKTKMSRPRAHACGHGTVVTCMLLSRACCCHVHAAV
eukprot:2896223-Rhodomonas_salina.2